MKAIMLVALGIFLVPIVALLFLKRKDKQDDQDEMARLRAVPPGSPPRFCASMIKGLPEPARRYFTRVITADAPLFPVAEIEMRGQFSLGSKAKPNYMEMAARQILAAPDGFIWQMQAKSGLMTLSGSDSQSWTRFWLFGFIPVARFGGDADHRRSAFGRYIAEAAFWTPAALLPSAGLSWQQVDENTARYTVVHDGLEQSVDVVVDPEGYPTEVRFQRWSNANAEGVHRLQPFGGYLSRFRRFGGYLLPTHVEAGNQFGTDDYFPFFIAEVTDIRFPTP